MKRQGHLFEKACSFENLLSAAKKAQKGKRFKNSTDLFNLRLESNLINLQAQLRTKTYQMGAYKCFYIYDPKKRLISAAPYQDGVVQHALYNIIGPLFDKSFIDDSYACRKAGPIELCGAVPGTTITRTTCRPRTGTTIIPAIRTIISVAGSPST